MEGEAWVEAPRCDLLAARDKPLGYGAYFATQELFSPIKKKIRTDTISLDCYALGEITFVPFGTPVPLGICLTPRSPKV